MDITTLFGAIGSAVSGGVLGLFGNGIKAWADYKAEEAKRAFDLAMRKADREEMQLEHDLHMKQVETEADRDIAIANQNRMTTESQVAADVELAEMTLRSNSYSHDKATYGGGFVDGVRGLMRPVITLYFAIIMTVIAYQLMKLNNGQWVNPTEAQAMLREVINAIIFLTTTAVTWWFGSRPSNRGK